MEKKQKTAIAAGVVALGLAALLIGANATNLENPSKQNTESTTTENVDTDSGEGITGSVFANEFSGEGFDFSIAGNNGTTGKTPIKDVLTSAQFDSITLTIEDENGQDIVVGSNTSEDGVLTIENVDLETLSKVKVLPSYYIELDGYYGELDAETAEISGDDGALIMLEVLGQDNEISLLDAPVSNVILEVLKGKGSKIADATINGIGIGTTYDDTISKLGVPIYEDYLSSESENEEGSLEEEGSYTTASFPVKNRGAITTAFNGGGKILAIASSSNISEISELELPLNADETALSKIAKADVKELKTSDDGNLDFAMGKLKIEIGSTDIGKIKSEGFALSDGEENEDLGLASYAVSGGDIPGNCTTTVSTMLSYLDDGEAEAPSDSNAISAVEISRTDGTMPAISIADAKIPLQEKELADSLGRPRYRTYTNNLQTYAYDIISDDSTYSLQVAYDENGELSKVRAEMSFGSGLEF